MVFQMHVLIYFLILVLVEYSILLGKMDQTSLVDLIDSFKELISMEQWQQQGTMMMELESSTKLLLLIRMGIEESELKCITLYGLMWGLSVLAIQPMEIFVVFIMVKKSEVTLY